MKSQAVVQVLTRQQRLGVAALMVAIESHTGHTIAHIALLEEVLGDMKSRGIITYREGYEAIRLR